ncbi:MAG: hypothetical protein ABS86_01110 [Sphingobium sp. SCN 64-10]|nr:MAG: hypothetical protein ABS86_01110 [Sphingobium sp. SCN 64-10]
MKPALREAAVRLNIRRKFMTLSLLELPVIVSAFVLQPSSSTPPTPVPTPCAGQHRTTVADCCVHVSGWDRPADQLLLTSLRASSSDDERKASHVDLR